jgi:hypothetical protein
VQFNQQLSYLNSDIPEEKEGLRKSIIGGVGIVAKGV